MATLAMQTLARNRSRFARDQDGSLNLNAGLAIVGVVIGAVVVMAIIAALLPTFLGSLADTNAAFNDPNATTGDATADSLLPIFPILIGLGGLIAIVGLVLAAVHFGGRKA